VFTRGIVSGMDIVIRALNRPYCLDRVLRSLERHVSGVGKITVVDDGTPQPLLDEITRRWPDLVILKSDNWEVKSGLCAAQGLGRQLTFEIARLLPVPGWIEAVHQSSDHFMLLEDDLWFTRDVDLDAVSATMTAQRLAMVRLSSFGQTRTFPNPEPLPSVGNLGLEQSRPEWLDRSRKSSLARNVYAVRAGDTPLDRFTWRTARRAKLVSRDHRYHLWGVFADSGAMFTQEYWHAIWDPEERAVDENLQLTRAYAWACDHPEAQFARFAEGVLGTTYGSCATGRRWPEMGCDMYVFNSLMNAAWLAGELDDAMDSNDDFPDELVVGILDRAQHPDCPTDAWRAWHERMLGVYTAI